MLTMFLKDVPPWTRRQNLWFCVYLTMCAAILAALIGYEVWMQRSTGRLDFVHVNMITGLEIPCSRRYFWGHSIRFRGGGGEEHGVLCRDWRNGRWVFETFPDFGG